MCSVSWGVLSAVGVFSIMGGDISRVPWGDITSTVWGYLEYRGGCSVPSRDIMILVGGYHDLLLFEYRKGIS